MCRLLEVPRHHSEEAEAAGRDEWSDQRLAALVSAYHAGPGPAGGSVLVGWRRAQAFGQTEVFVGGDALITESGDAARC